MDVNTIKQEQWPELAFENWKDTIATLHLWTQIVGKIRLKQMPWLNHSWHVTLYVSANGLTTGSIPYQGGVFQIDFDFIHHLLHITTSAGGIEKVNLYPRSVADFYRELLEKLRNADIDACISAGPNEVDPAIPFEKDETYRFYDATRVRDFQAGQGGLVFYTDQSGIYCRVEFTKDDKGNVTGIKMWWSDGRESYKPKEK